MKYIIILHFLFLFGCAPQIIVEKTPQEFKCEEFHNETIYAMWVDGCFHSLHKIYSTRREYVNPLVLRHICYMFFEEMSHLDSEP